MAYLESHPDSPPVCHIFPYNSTATVGNAHVEDTAIVSTDGGRIHTSGGAPTVNI